MVNRPGSLCACLPSSHVRVRLCEELAVVNTPVSLCAHLSLCGVRVSVCGESAVVNMTVSLRARLPSCGVQVRACEELAVVNMSESLCPRLLSGGVRAWEEHAVVAMSDFVSDHLLLRHIRRWRPCGTSRIVLSYAATWSTDVCILVESWCVGVGVQDSICDRLRSSDERVWEKPVGVNIIMSLYNYPPFSAVKWWQLSGLSFVWPK